VPKKTPEIVPESETPFLLCSQIENNKVVATASQSQRFFFDKTGSLKRILDIFKNVQTKKLGVLFSDNFDSMILEFE